MTAWRAAVLISLWMSVAGGFYLCRSSTALVWDDSPLVTENLYDVSKPLVWADPSLWGVILTRSFNNIGGDGYRPLSRLIRQSGTAYFSDPQADPNLWFAGVAMIIGAVGVCAFFVTRRYVKTDAGGVLAVSLFLFSTPFITGAWIVFAGIQAIVPLMICLGLILYWKVVESRGGRFLYFFGLCVVLFFGPWFREFVGILPLLIVFLEVQRARHPTILMGVAGLFFLHAVYPTVIPKLTFYPDLPLKSVFAIGLLGTKTQINIIMTEGSASLISRLWSEIKWETPLHFLTLFPPSLLALAFIALLLPVVRQILVCLGAGLNLIADRKAFLHRLSRWKEILIPGLFLLGAIGSLKIRVRPSYWFPFWLCLGLHLLALYRDAFLAWWLFLSFVPFLKVFTEQVHLAYAMLPASIILVTSLEDLWRSLKSRGNVFRAIRYAFIAVIIVAVGDHLLNPYSSYRVIRSVNNGILETANWFKSHVPAGSIVIGNTLHAEDIRLFSANHIQVRWIMRAGISREDGAVSDPASLEQLLKQNEGKRAVYFLEVDFNYPPDKVAYHSHGYVRNRSVAMEEIGLIHTTKVMYLYLDPFKALVPRSYISFLGAPDLENDFYRGPAQNGMPFFREVYAEYRVYKVTGTKVNTGFEWSSKLD